MEKLLKLNIQTFAETPEGTEPENTEEEVKEVVPEVVEKVDEVVPFSITEEEYKKSLQSSASKAKNELLKEIGYNSVEDIKGLISKGTQTDALNDELNALKEANINLTTQIKISENNELAKAFNIPEQSKDLFIKLVDGLEGDATREEKAQIIKEQLQSIVGTNLKGGVEQQATIKKTEAEEVERLRNL